MVQLDPSEFQVSVARVFFGLNVSRQYVVAGGAGLLARELINRPTQDLDFFTHLPNDGVTEARDALIHALDERGLVATLLVDSRTFCRIYVSSPGGTDPEEVLVDLAIDSPPTSPPTMTVLGPTLAPSELADMMRTLDRFTDEEVPLPPDSVTEARAFFKTWAAELA